MACWIVRLQGGPRRSNQAAVAIGHKIYTFGLRRCFFDDSDDQPIEGFGVHVLNTVDYRWKPLPTTPVELDPGEEFIDGKGIAYKPYGEMPSRRIGHTVVEYEGLIYMWGGYCPISDGLCSKMYCFHPEQQTWSVIPSANKPPLPRAKHSAIVYNDMMYIYGGLKHDPQNNRTMLCNEIWTYNFKTREWHSPNIHGEMPPRRYQHTACVIEGKMYVYGGIDGDRREVYLDIYHILENYWEKPQTRGRRPHGVRGACCWVHNNKIYLFGGCRYRDERYLASLHRFDPETLVWHKISPFGIECPLSRERHCGVIVGDCVYIFSGFT
uniref:Kelch-like protein 10 n=1 Tax=Elaeophora elaphi TaxID=1147741 RepID=A0A0R3S6B6_9BILA